MKTTSVVLTVFGMAMLAHADSVVATPAIATKQCRPTLPGVTTCIVVTDQAPGKVVVTTATGNIGGTFTGDHFNPSAVMIKLQVGGVPISYTIPMGLNSAFVGEHAYTLNGVTDALTFVFNSFGAGVIQYQITLNGEPFVMGNF